MDEASQLTELLRQSLVQERDVAFAATVRKRALSHARRRLWIGRTVACAGVLALALIFEEARRAAVTALAAAATGGNGLLLEAPIGLALAAVALFTAGLASTRL